MKRFVLPAAVLLLLIISCAPRPTASGEQAPFDPARDREELIGNTWTVNEIFGETIVAPEGRDQAYLKFTADGKVQGHTGCNPINGTYTLEDGLRIKFSDMAAGLAYCAEVPYEGKLLEVLNDTDNYTLNNGSLSLNKARMAPMATLEKSE